MFDLQSPVSLFALAALTIPIVIHLLNKREGKRIKFGSIRFLYPSERNRLKSLKFNEIPLLLLRCLILILLVLMLAQPYWLQSSSKGNSKGGWILISPDLLNGSRGSVTKKRIDSLLTSGNELRLFAHDFQKISLQDSMSGDSTSANYWSLLSEADRVAPANLPFWIFTCNRVTNIRGARPLIQRPVKWFLVGVRRQNQWIEKAHEIAGDSLQIVIGISDSSGTQFQTFVFKKPDAKKILSEDEIAFEVNPEENGRIKIRLLTNDLLSGDNEFVFNTRTAVDRFIVYHDRSRKEDAGYVSAALEAIGAGSGTKASVAVQSVDESAQSPDSESWIFWLSDSPVPQHWLDNALVIVRDARSSEYQEMDSEILAVNESTLDPPRLFRRVQPLNRGAVLWKDGFGLPLLEIQRKESAILIDYHSRFQPFWSELVLNPVFLEWFSSLNEFVKSGPGFLTSDMSVSDQRYIDDGQIQPFASDAELAKPAKPTDLQMFFWVAAFVLFVFERFLSEQKHSV